MGESKDGNNIVILLPGLTGGSGCNYVRHFVVRARKSGFRVVVFNSRGCADSPVVSPQFYSARFTSDMRQVVDEVKKSNPQSRIFCVGWSLGANILINYLSDFAEDSTRTITGTSEQRLSNVILRTMTITKKNQHAPSLSSLLAAFRFWFRGGEQGPLPWLIRLTSSCLIAKSKWDSASCTTTAWGMRSRKYTESTGRCSYTPLSCAIFESTLQTRGKLSETLTKPSPGGHSGKSSASVTCCCATKRPA